MKNGIAFLSILFAVGSVEAAEEKPAEKETSTPEEIETTTDEKVQGLIGQLDSDEFEIRDKASKKLTALGEAIVPKLKAELKKENPPETRARIESVLKKIDEAGGTVNGLRVTLKADREDAKIGDTITFTTTIENRTEKDIVLNVGKKVEGNRFETGMDLQIWDVKDPTPPQRIEVISFRVIEPPSRSLFKTIPARGSVDFSSAFQVDKAPKGSDSKQVFKGPRRQMDGHGGDAHRFWIHFAIDEITQPKEWSGEMESNEVTVRSKIKKAGSSEPSLEFPERKDKAP